MKNLIAIILVTTSFVSSAFADTTFVCGGSRQTAQLTITDPIIQKGSYNECNGGVGDEMRDCHIHNYQIELQFAVIALKIDNDTLYSKMKLIGSGSALNGFEMLIYKDNTIHVTLKGDKENPFLNLKVMAQGAPGNPVEVGNYSLTCN